VHIAVDMIVELVVVETVCIVDVKLIVFVDVVNTGDGITVVVTEIVLQGTMVVDGGSVVEPMNVEVEVEAWTGKLAFRFQKH
jgi:hypothetical protein